ncbi:MAG: aminoacyl-tRNA hydrolase [Verrucomicrobiia bacterium]
MIRVVVGLGNPGREYVATRHNIGFLILDRWAAQHSAFWKKESRWQSEVTTVNLESEGSLQAIKLLKPLTFMNLSGTAVRSFLDWHQISAEEILVVADDVALSLGQLRLRVSGGTGGHNGLASVEQQLQTQSFARLRCGVGPLPESKNLSDYVLEPFASSERDETMKMIEKAVQATECACILGLATAMNQFNQIKNEL